MAVNVKNYGMPPPNSINSTHLQDGAVPLDSTKVTGSLDLGGSKISGSLDLAGLKIVGELPESKLADDIIGDSKIKANALTLAKAADDLAVSLYNSEEVEVSYGNGVDNGDIESDGIKELNFVKVGGHYNPKKIRFLASLKTNNSLYTATLNLYFNDEITPRIVLTSTSDSDYELVSGVADISDLPAGKHKWTMKLVSSDPAGIVYNDYSETKWVKGV